MILAFEVLEDGTPITNSKPKVFSFLPIQDYGFKFIIQADFIVTANRESIIKNVPWNEWMIKNIHELFLDSVDSFKSHEILKTNYYKYLPDKEINDSLFNPVVENIYSTLNDYECILTESGSWVKPSNVIYIKPRIKDLVSDEDIKKISGKEIISSKIPIGSLPSKLHIGTFKETNFFEFLKDKELIEKKSNEWLVSVYVYLLEYSYEHKKETSSLKKLPIFRLNNGELKSSEDITIFSNLGKSGKTYGFEDDLVNSVGILDHELYKLIEKNNNNKAILGLLSDLGIKSNNPSEIIEQYIFPNYNNDIYKEKDPRILQGHIWYIIDNPSYYKNNKDLIIKSIFLKTQKEENAISFKHPNQIYLSSEYRNKYDLDTLFSGFTEFSDNLLNTIYLEDSREFTENVRNLKIKIANKKATSHKILNK